jgi:hypothetical protein
MEIMWAKPGEKFNREVFRFSGKKGKKFKRLKYSLSANWTFSL